MFHGVFPSTPDVGEVIILGTGYFASGTVPFPGVTAQVGVQPSDKRKIQWMDIRALYRAHEQTVTLTFEECPVPDSIEPPTGTLNNAAIVKDGFYQVKSSQDIFSDVDE